jgi:hypothetical protein
MWKFHESHSEFLDGFLKLEPDVHIVRPYAAAKILGTHAEHVHFLLNNGYLPHINIGHTRYIFADFRKSEEGEGGKFYKTKHLPEGQFPYWTKSRLAGFGPPKPLKPKDPILDRLNDESRYISDEEMPLWMKQRFNQ